MTIEQLKATLALLVEWGVPENEAKFMLLAPLFPGAAAGGILLRAFSLKEPEQSG